MTKVPATILGTTLRAAIRRRGWTQQEFADRCGLSQGMVSDYIRGTRPINARVALLFESVLGRPRAEKWLAMQADHKLAEAYAAMTEPTEGG